MRVIGVRVRDQRPIDRQPGINVKAAGLGVQA
jgi:hypothetical protein